MKKVTSIGFALLMIFAVFVPFASAINDPTVEGYQTAVNADPVGDGGVVDNQGQLVVNLLCRSPQIGGEFSIAPVTVSQTFTNGERVSSEFVSEFVTYQGAVTTEQFRADGTFDTRLPYGTYVLALQDGNGGQPEYALVSIVANQATQTVSFQGHGITAAEMSAAEPVVTITEATYGIATVVIDQAAVPAIPAVTHTVHHAAVPAVPATPAVPAHYENVGHNHGDYDKIAGHYIYVGQNHGDYKFVAAVAAVPATPAVPAYDEIVVDVPAVPAVPEISHVEGTIIDVTADVQALADGGQFSFKFDNSQNPGGIFDTANNLLKQIADPASGQVKNVHIEFTVDGVAKTIDTQEYQTINLV